MVIRPTRNHTDLSESDEVEELSLHDLRRRLRILIGGTIQGRGSLIRTLRLTPREKAGDLVTCLLENGRVHAPIAHRVLTDRRSPPMAP